MSRKVSHRSSITNRPTCGGPIKAGLAPRSTNFMMGVKRNHHFSGKSFAGKAADYPPECRGGDSNGGGSSSGDVLLGAGHSSGLSCDGMYEDCRFVKWTGRGIDPRYKYKGYKTSCNDWCKECCDKSWGCKKAYCVGKPGEEECRFDWKKKATPICNIIPECPEKYYKNIKIDFCTAQDCSYHLETLPVRSKKFKNALKYENCCPAGAPFDGWNSRGEHEYRQQLKLCTDADSRPPQRASSRTW